MAMPLLIINCGGEMVKRSTFVAGFTILLQLYILEQRLQAQSIVEEKSLRGPPALR